MSDRTSRKAFTRFATLTSLAISPVALVLLTRQGYTLAHAVLITMIVIAAFRYVVDWCTRGLVDHPNLFEDTTKEARDDDARYRRRLAFWVHKFRTVSYVVGFITLVYGIQRATGASNVSWLGTLHSFTSVFHQMFGTSQGKMQILQIMFLFPMNFLLFMGPMLLTGISQIRGFEPGDANWGVKLDDVRGQKEAKDEIRKIITLWQSGERFVRAGGKRERGILFLGAPGTGKTMLAKAIATGFNSPIVTIPGSGFAQTFIGIDAIITRFLIRKAKKLARKWNGQCIVFIDEIDAVGMRRGSLGVSSSVNQIPGGMFGGGMGSMALNQLLVSMDGVDAPPFIRRLLTNKVNLYLDALYIVPGRIGKFSLRLPSAKPRDEQVYFIGATNVPLEALDPALVRPGRMGRHIHFRTPTKKDRIDIFDLYLEKVSHESSLDNDHSREELARVTSGYSPADIEQACSLALMYANFAGREKFSREDILEAMVTVEAGTALGWGYEKPEEELSTAIHEAGHAVCAHIYIPEVESTRLSVVRRGATGGHHQVADVEERTFSSRADLFYSIVWGLGAYAAEYIFYGHNTNGVGGDLGGISATAGLMVGRWGMAPMTDDLDEVTTKRLKRIGKRLLIAASKGDITFTKEKYDDEALIVGHAFIVAYNTVRANKISVEKIAQTLVAKKEIYGDELVKLLNSCELFAPEIDYTQDESWPSFGSQKVEE